MPLSQKLILRLGILLVILLLVTGYVYSRGAREDPFAEIDLLFSEKRYALGIEKLNEILKGNPELFEEVQARNAVYLEVQKAISLLEEGIIEDIKNENPEGIFAKIGAIRELDPQPNVYRAAVLTDYLYEAAVIVNKGKVDEIMDAALALVRQGEYWEAVALYATGLDIGREIFETSGYGELAVEGVLFYRNALESSIGEFADTERAFKETVAQLETALEEGSIPAVGDAVDNLYLNLQSLAGFRKGIKSIENVLQEARSSLSRRREDNRDIAYLRYIHTYLVGREEAGVEGVLPIVDELWRSTYTVAESRVTAYFTQLYEAARAGFESGQLDAGVDGFRRVVAAAPVTAKMASLGTTYVIPDRSYALDAEERTSLEATFDKVVFTRGRERISAEHIQAAPLLQRTESLTNISDSAPVGLLLSRRLQIDDAVRELNTALSSARDEARYFTDLDSKGIDATEEMALFAELQQRLTDAVAASRNFDVMLATRIADSRIEDLREDFDPLGRRVEEGRRFVEGILTTVTGEEVAADASEEERSQAILKKYPGQGLTILFGARSTLRELGRETVSTLANLRNDKEYVLADGRMQSSLRLGDELSNEIGRLEARVLDLIALAEERIRLADLYRDEAYEYISAAEEEIAVENFTGARNLLTRASNAALESISNRQDDAFASEVNNRVAFMTDEINSALVRVVVREVDELVSVAQQLYARQEYDAAEGALLQAQSRWASVYPEPDSYIEYYLSLVQTALSVQTGRDIPATDSLYREMRQYLNYALADYKEAEILLAARDSVGAQRKLRDVSNNLRIVLQQYPYNEEANILNWRIKRIEDIDAYNRDIREAVTNARVEINTPAAADAYSRLQTIKKLEPNYPGLDALIFQAEINLGIRTPPQTVERRNQALDLYNEALELYNTGVAANFEEALSRLNQALVIDPNYTAARELRNTINAEKGGTVTTTLSSSEDMQFYLQAVRLVGENRPEQALLIIRRLWNNQTNRNYRPLIDLKSSVERALGVGR